ncbi:MAG: DUF1836 domain-containing protein [Lachnospiraceae bacterium]
MTINTEDLLNSILGSLSRIDYIKPNDFPDIALYMDQVTTFMDSHLTASKRHSQDKVLTKTMINNYAKNNLLPPPVKKKYSKEHLLTLIFIYYFKNILTINDIQSILNPLTGKYFGEEIGFNLEDIYEEVFHLEKDQVERMKEDIILKFEVSRSTFPNAPEQDSEFLQMFSFICLLSFDVYVKKQLIEKMIDSLQEKDTSEKTEKHKKTEE